MIDLTLSYLLFNSSILIFFIFKQKSFIRSCINKMDTDIITYINNWQISKRSVFAQIDPMNLYTNNKKNVASILNYIFECQFSYYFLSITLLTNNNLYRCSNCHWCLISVPPTSVSSLRRLEQRKLKALHNQQLFFSPLYVYCLFE